MVGSVLMRRWRRLAARSTLALCVAGAVASPGAVAAAERPLSHQWWFTSWAVEEDLWPASKGQGVTVAVIDTGVQASLPELNGVVLPGRDFETGGGDGRTDANPDFGSPGHGTRMAALIAAQGTGSGFLGVAPEAKVLPLVAQLSVSSTKAIRFAADRGAKVINLSQGLPGSCPTDMQNAIAYALGKDAVVVAGAGNDGSTTNDSIHPANCKGVLVTGAVDANIRPWANTQRQPYVTIAAPGYLVGSVNPDGQLVYNLAGTSQATALTSGIVALVRSKFPEMSNREVVRQIIASAKDIGPKGRDDRTGYGFIRPYRIMQGMIPKNSPNPVFADYDKLEKPADTEAAPADAEAAPAGGPSSSSSSTSLIIMSTVAGVIVVLVILAFVFVRRGARKRPAPAAGPVPGAPPAFGGPYPPQWPPQAPPPGYQGPGAAMPPRTYGDVPPQYPPQPPP